MGKNYKSVARKYKEGRDREIVITASVGVITSLFLSVFVIVSALMTDSTTMVLDGVEIITTALGSVIAIVGIKLSQKQADINHPLGYGRTEYLGDMVVAFIIIYVGITATYTEIQSFKHPRIPNHTSLSMLILGISCLVKLMLGFNEKNIGKKVHSRALLAASVDSFANAFVSLSIMISSWIYTNYHVNIEAYIGIAISFLIIRSGFVILKATFGELLGSRVNPKLVKKIRNTICDFEGVHDVHDLVLHSYGRYRYVGSVYIDILSDMSVLELERLQRGISETIYREFGVSIHPIGVYVINPDDEELTELYRYTGQLVSKRIALEGVHGIFLDKDNKEICLDLIVNCAAKDKDAVIQEFEERMLEKYEDYKIHIHRDLPVV